MKKVTLSPFFVCILVALISATSFSQVRPGSGNALSLNGINNYIEIPNSTSLNPAAYTIECWVRILSNTGTTGGTNGAARHIIFKQRPATYYFEYIALDYFSNVGAFYAVTTSSSNAQIVCTTPQNFVSFNKWYHLAVSADDQNLNLYVNGVLMASKPTGFTLNPGSKNLYIGRTNEPAFEGFCNMNIDEVRIWNKVLPEKQIRDWMCKTITKSHPSYSRLVSYYRFDQSGSTTLNDAVGKNNGTIFNNPAWIESAAAIGNASAYTYGASSVSLKSRDGEKVKVDKIKGNPAGVQVYRVDKAPSKKKGINGLGPNNRYFGVFPFGDSAVKYRIAYTYTGNPYVIKANEGSLNLYMRTDNADSKWKDASAELDTTKNNLTSTQDTTGEYILGSSGVPLQIPKSVSINDTSIKEGNSTTKILKIPIRLNEAAVFNSSVNYATADSTALSGQDYISKSGTVNFLAGQVTDTIRLNVKGNTNAEPDEIFKLLLSEPVNVSIPDSVVFITINNDDGPNFHIGKAEEAGNLLTGKSSFNVLPNPAKDFINIVSSKDITDALVKITEIGGKTLYRTRKNFVGGQQLKVSLSQLPKGILIVTIATNNDHEEFRIIKE